MEAQPQTDPKPISSLVSAQPNLRPSPATANSEPPAEAELTPDEQAAVLLAARQAKALKQKNDTYWKRVLNPVTAWTPDELGNWILSESIRHDPQGLNPRYIGPKGFILDEISRPIFDLLCMYFTNHPDFEQAGKLYDQFAESEFSLDKGIALIGPTGCGKTTLFWLFCDNPRQSYTVTPCKLAADSYEGAPTSAEAKLIYNRFTGRSDIYGGRFRQGLGGRMYDDLGNEPIPVNSFGGKRNLMLDIFERRYDIGPDGAGLTHMTTNLTSDQIESLYGKRLRSRFREMYNLIAFDPQTPDRRR